MEKTQQSPRWPIALNVFILPGLGQLFQKRFVKGGLIIVGFLAGGYVLSESAGQILETYYSLADFETEVPEKVPGVKRLVGGLGMCLLMWLIAVGDSIWNAKRVPIEDNEGEGRE